MAASSQESTTRAFAAFAFLLPDGSSDDDGYDDSDDETLPRDQGPRRPRRSDVRGLEAWRVGWRGAPAVKYLGTLTERLAQEHLRLFGVSQDVFRCFLDKIRDGYAAGAHDFGWDGDRQVVVAWAAANGISLDLGTATDVNKSAVVEAARAAGCPWDARKLVDDTAPREADSRPRPPPIPLSLKVMGVLKAVVSGESMLSAGLFVGVSESTLSALFLKVIAFVSTSATLYGDYVRYPTTHDELTLAEEPFRRVGYPGCVALSDGVHFLWNQAPAGERWRYVGKAGVPTIVANITVSAKGRIIYISRVFPGAINDKTIMKSDAFFEYLRTSPVATSFEWVAVALAADMDDDDVGASADIEPGDGADDDAVYVNCAGAYLATDGGYSARPTIMFPKKMSTTIWERRWSKRLESVRKRVECVFGMLKMRFSSLRSASLKQDELTLEHHLRFCAVLYNMQGDAEMKFDICDEDYVAADLYVDEARIRRDCRQGSAATQDMDTDDEEAEFEDDGIVRDGEDAVESRTDARRHEHVRATLIRHFKALWRWNAIEWLT